MHTPWHRPFPHPLIDARDDVSRQLLLDHIYCQYLHKTPFGTRPACVRLGTMQHSIECDLCLYIAQMHFAYRRNRDTTSKKTASRLVVVVCLGLVHHSAIVMEMRFANKSSSNRYVLVCVEVCFRKLCCLPNHLDIYSRHQMCIIWLHKFAQRALAVVVMRL